MHEAAKETVQAALSQASGGGTVLVASALLFVECQANAFEVMEDALHRKGSLVVAVDEYIAQEVRDLQRVLDKKHRVKLSNADAIHVATAAKHAVSRFVTLDRRCKDGCTSPLSAAPAIESTTQLRIISAKQYLQERPIQFNLC